MTNCQNFARISKKLRKIIMAQVPENIGCENPECIAKDECKRQVIAKNGTAVEIKKFGGTPTKKCGKFLEK
jgi:aspartate carbamoyltransferase regulatory subunit